MVSLMAVNNTTGKVEVFEEGIEDFIYFKGINAYQGYDLYSYGTTDDKGVEFVPYKNGWYKVVIK